MRISATTLESYRLWRDPEQEWMSEDDLRDSILNVWKPNHKVNLGKAFGSVLEDPCRYVVPGGFRVIVAEETFEFGRDVIEPCLVLIDRRGVFEAKAQKSYGPVDVVSKADHLLGAHLSEFKTTLSSFDVTKYLDSYQWRFMADAFEPSQITYRVFCLDEANNGVISLKDIHTFNLFPYVGLHEDCEALLREFCGYVEARGLADGLRQRQREAA
jgi:hypothetical protein